MDELATSFIKQIADKTALTNTLVLIQLAVWIVFGAAAAIAGPYLKKRAETLATKADFDTLKQQLKDTTEVVEKVKVEIAHGDWAEREWKTLRRLKLEEMLRLAYETRNWIERYTQNCLLRKGEDLGSHKLADVTNICFLYLPELRNEVTEFNNFTLDVIKLLTAHELAVRTKQTNSDHLIRGKKLGEFQELFKDMTDALVSVRDKAPNVMGEILGVKPVTSDSEASK